MLAIIPLVLIISACASGMVNLVTDGTVKLETVSSRAIHFERVAIYASDTGLVVSGELHKRHHGRGPISGHIDIQVVASDGAILATTNIKYYRGSHKSRTSNFFVEIPIELPMNSTVRIMHHDAFELEHTES
jgi:hypothetical protein